MDYTVLNILLITPKMGEVNMDCKILIINEKEFKQIPINKNYYISRYGDVYSQYCQRVIKGDISTTRGKLYKRVNIKINGKAKHFLVHRLVYMTWVGTIEENEQINHKDDDSLNNNYLNLYKGTQKENIQDCINNENRVGNVFYLTIYDKKINKTLTFCPASNFIEYCGHSNKSGCLNRFFNKQWFKKRYEVIEFKKINNLQEYRSATTKGDECSPVE